MLIFVLPTENRLVVSFWTFFQISLPPQRIRINRNHQKILLCRGIFLYRKTGFHLVNSRPC